MSDVNAGGTGKDRAARYMIMDALRRGLITQQGGVYEGTSGSTGIALAGVCGSLGLPLHIVMPDDQADEKRHLLETLGVRVVVVPSCAISNENHYVNQARSLARRNGGFFVDQFENEMNARAHYETTGPEIYRQIRDEGLEIDAFVMVRMHCNPCYLLRSYAW